MNQEEFLQILLQFETQKEQEELLETKRKETECFNHFKKKKTFKHQINYKLIFNEVIKEFMKFVKKKLNNRKKEVAKELNKLKKIEYMIEYRQLRRDYKEYRQIEYYLGDERLFKPKKKIDRIAGLKRKKYHKIYYEKHKEDDTNQYKKLKRIFYYCEMCNKIISYAMKQCHQYTYEHLGNTFELKFIALKHRNIMDEDIELYNLIIMY